MDLYMNIGLLIIATNKYTCFLQPLIESADRFFFSNGSVKYHIFTDQNPQINTKRKYFIHKIEHKKWPFNTLMRYNFFIDYADILQTNDYIYYCDVDMLFVNNVGEEILGDLVGTIHPGFMGGRGTPETNPKSLAYVHPNESMRYCAGGFNGGSVSNFLKMSDTISTNINTDLSNNMIAIWHDESHMNRYFIDNPPTKLLSPSYCYPESWNLPFPKKILALDKNHKEMRD